MTVSDALFEPARRASDLPRERACLRCETRFESEWSGERICKRCKSSTSWRSAAPIGASSTGRRR